MRKCKLFMIFVVLSIVIAFTATPVMSKKQEIELTPIGTYKTAIFDEGAAEIVSYDAHTQRLFVVNGGNSTIDILDISDPTTPTLWSAIDLTPYGKQANSVAVNGGVVAVAVENDDKQAAGAAVFFDADGNFLSQVMVGALPDMITFSPNGRWVLVANEGEPSDDYMVDPEGSVSVIDLRRGVDDLSVSTADFTAFTVADLDPSVRIFGPGATVAQDLEPEYITVSHNSKTAWVTLQENNAIASIDIKSAEVTDIFGLGFKDHSLEGNDLDASNKDGMIHIANWPAFGMVQPDSIGSYWYRGQTLLVTANEGDSRDYDGFSEEARVEDVVLDPDAFPDAAKLQTVDALGRLKITTVNGDTDNDGDFDELYAYGARSFSIWTGDGTLIFDSGDEFERITASVFPDDFNSTDNENGSFDDRSDDKGPEPEALAVGKVYGRTYAFIGLERIGGIMIYDITDPYAPEFIQYINTRDFSGNPELGTAGDLAPEGLKFISAGKSPNGKALLVSANEVSGSTVIFEIDKK